MAVETLLRRGLYRDSVTLMRLAAALEARPGVARASAVMATPANLEMLAEHGVPVSETEAGANDLLVVLEGDDGEVLAESLDAAAALLESEARPAAAAGADTRPRRPRSLAEATEALPGATLALISCPGEYAAAEAMKALRLGLDAMIFSDNVPVADEVALKREAEGRGRLVMGPDCGTAIVGGVPLGFANRARRGSVGVVGASGTGIQQVTCLIDRLGAGISHAIGTGGRDLSREVGGATTLRALAMLADDEDTEHRRPGLQAARRGRDAPRARRRGGNGEAGRRLLRRGGAAAGASRRHALRRHPRRGGRAGGGVALAPDDIELPRAAGRDRLVGLFSGGTLCCEAQAVAAPVLGRILSNAPLDPGTRSTAIRAAPTSCSISATTRSPGGGRTR